MSALAVILMTAMVTPGMVPATVASLTEGVLKTMFLIKLKAVSMVLLVVAALSGGVGLLYKTHAAEQPRTLVATEQAETEKQRAANKKDEKAELKKKSDRFPDGRAHDFGEVKHGTSLKNTFRIVNMSNAPLNLTSVRVSNGCMTGTVSKRVLQPKEEGKVEVTVNTRRFVGSKTIGMLLTVEQGGNTETLKFLITANSVKGD